MKTSNFDLKSVGDIRVRDYAPCPVVTYRSVGFAKVGSNLIPLEIFTSEQFRRTTVQEGASGLGRWLAASSHSMSIHQAPPGYSPEDGLASVLIKH